MADNSELPDDHNIADIAGAISSEDVDSSDEKITAKDTFAETFEQLMSILSDQLRETSAEQFVVIVKHSEAKEPFVFYGAPHVVDAAALMAGVLREIKKDLFDELDTEPRN